MVLRLIACLPLSQVLDGACDVKLERQRAPFIVWMASCAMAHDLGYDLDRFGEFVWIEHRCYRQWFALARVRKRWAAQIKGYSLMLSAFTLSLLISSWLFVACLMHFC